MTIDDAVILEDRYRFLEKLGHGGMADVFRARDELLDRDVAIKVLREVEDPGLRARFVAEARLLASLDHPNLVTLLDAGIRSDRPYLVMTLACGPTMAAQIANGPLDGAVVAEIGVQVGEALAYAHRRGVVHRDVKPSNILLSEDSRALLADFGIARLADCLDQQTRTGETIGSLPYLAPEQAAGQPITTAADIYSLGLVLLEALTGERAYQGQPMAAAVARLTCAPAMPTSLPRAWRDLLVAMTDREPTSRPRSEEVVGSLAGIIAGTPAPVPVPEVATGSFTRPLVIPTMDSETDDREVPDEPPSHIGVSEGGPSRAWRPRWAWVLAAVIVTAVLGAVVLAAPGGGAPTQASVPGTEIPSGVPARYQQPLKNLHEEIFKVAR